MRIGDLLPQGSKKMEESRESKMEGGAIGKALSGIKLTTSEALSSGRVAG